jgi:hypothetical protein
MKPKLIEKTIALGMGGMLLLGLAGCASSSGYDTGNKTADQIQTAAGRIDALTGKIDVTLTSLNDLVEKPQADLRPQFKTYSDNVTGVETSAKEIADARRKMGEQGKVFFDKWDQQLAQIQNEDIKARSQSRKDEVAKKLQTIKMSYTEAEMAFRPFMADLKDVQKFLSVDLTTGGIAAVKGPAAKANTNAVPLKAAITKLASDFKALGLSMSSVTQAATNAPAPAK